MRPGAPKMTILQISVVLQVVVGSTTIPVADLSLTSDGGGHTAGQPSRGSRRNLINGREIARARWSSSRTTIRGSRVPDRNSRSYSQRSAQIELVIAFHG